MGRGRQNDTDLRVPGTLRMMIGTVKIEFFHADQVAAQHQIEEPQTLGGLPIAGLKDLMAMKLIVLAERGELRDYYDVMQIDLHGGVSVEDGIAYFLRRYGLMRSSGSLQHLIRALGYLDDTEEDDEVPMSKSDRVLVAPASGPAHPQPGPLTPGRAELRDGDHGRRSRMSITWSRAENRGLSPRPPGL